MFKKSLAIVLSAAMLLGNGMAAFRRGSATALGGMDAKYSVTGTWFIGLDIYGFPVGASFDETLKSPTITMDIN